MKKMIKQFSKSVILREQMTQIIGGGAGGRCSGLDCGDYCWGQANFYECLSTCQYMQNTTGPANDRFCRDL